MGGYLTERQKEILDFVRAYQRDRGIAPTHREVCDRFGFSSYGTAYKHLRLLADKGYLKRQRHQRRGLELVAPEPPAGHRDLDLPFFGRIAAGRPIEAVAGDETVSVPPLLVHDRPADHYVLQVVGESMIDEGIHDGDWVIVERREQARSGEMVVALVADEVTLKRVFPEGDRVRLQPANATMAPLWVATRDLRIQGIVVGLMRRY
jgi:repressor LexA